MMILIMLILLQDILPLLAKEYGFEYELVQYKWPRWLHQQTEKQRIIWGYKILFLDVLFPLDVKKIIFVDADQVNQNVSSSVHSWKHFLYWNIKALFIFSEN